MIHDQQGFRPADRQIAADRVSRLARVRGIDALPQSSALLGSPSESFSRFGHPPFQALDGVPAGAHDDDLPQPVIRLAARRVGEYSAAKSRNEPGLSERGLARAAIRYDCDQPMAPEFVDKLGNLLTSPKKSICIRFRHCLEADERTVNHDGLLDRRPTQYRAQELRELLGIIQGVAYSFIAPGEGRQRFGARAFFREDGNKWIIRRASRSRKSQPNLAFHPVHDSISADHDGECRGFLADHFLQLGLPANARCKVVLIQPYSKARGARVGAIKKTAFQFAGSFVVCA